MRCTWYITAKELLQNRRDPLATLFTIFLPVIFTVVLGLVIGSAESDRLPLALADEDKTAASQVLAGRLEDSAVLEVRDMDAQELEDAVHEQQVAAGLIVPAGFGVALDTGSTIGLQFVQVETATGSQSARQGVAGVVSGLNASLMAGEIAAERVATQAGLALDDDLVVSARSFVDTQLSTPAVTLGLTAAGTATETHARGFDQSSPGMIVNFVLFGLMGVAIITVLERRQGLLRRLSVAGVRAHHIVGGKMLAMFLLTFLMQLLLVLVGQFALGVDYLGSPLALLATMVSLSLLASAFGLLISAVLRSEPAVIATIVIAAQLLAALGGAWFPLEVTSAGFSQAAHFLPTAWIMDSFHGIILKDWGMRDVLFPLGIVWAWIVAVFGVAVWRYQPD